ncbi:uncharacterized protein G2W53_022546 [Senna tora]|uniref:Uncharacterized protein n=1 Tax=Senna tora TaxID=362788 RepID=A0A834TMV2_9FABA|nr:uncharacterized protein G2W53_022546 [Senna tora]
MEDDVAAWNRRCTVAVNDSVERTACLLEATLRFSQNEEDNRAENEPQNKYLKLKNLRRLKIKTVKMTRHYLTMVSPNRD